MMNEEDMDIESSCTKTKLLIDKVTGEILTVALSETELDCLDEPYQNSDWLLWPMKFRLQWSKCKNLAIKYFLESKRIVASCFRERKVWFSGEIEIFCKFRLFRSAIFSTGETFSKTKLLNDALQLKGGRLRL